MSQGANYIFAQGNRAQERLDLIQIIYGPHSLHYLKQQNLQGANVLELACGTGNMTKALLQEVGTKGSVTATDIANSQIEITKQNTGNPSNLHTLVGPVENTIQSLSTQFDLIYIRFLLIHLPNPRDVIASLKPLLKANGRIIIEELILSTMQCEPANYWFDRHLNLYLNFYRQQDLDPDFGLKLYPSLTQAGFIVENIEHIQPCLYTSQLKNLTLLRLHECRLAYLQNGLSETQYKEMDAAFQQLCQDQSTVITAGILCHAEAKLA